MNDLRSLDTSNAALYAACGFFLAQVRYEGANHWAWRVTRIVIARAMR